MIQPQELRIGNWVGIVKTWKGEPMPMRYASIEVEDFQWIADGEYECYPIGLSPEVLAKCGFQKEEDEWWRTWHGQFREEIWLCELENGSFALSHDHYFTLHEGVSSVHMLQNAFWIVTRQELSLTP